MRPIHIDKKVARTTFYVNNCAGATSAIIEITRVRGDKTIVYPALEIDSDKVTFAWDSELYKFPEGRYQGIIRMEGCKPFCVPIHLGCKCSMGATENGYFQSEECLGCK